MATIVANAGSLGSWTSGATWVGGVAPTAADDAVVGVGTTTITINNAGAVCRSLDFTGFTGVCTHNAASTLTIGDGTTGAGNSALKMSAGMTYTKNSATTSRISFVGTSATAQAITSAGQSFSGLIFNGAGGSWVLQDALIFNASATCTLSGGTINTNNFNFTGGTFSVSGAATCALTLGSSVVSLADFNFPTTNSFTLNAGTSAITLTVASGSTSVAGLTFYDLTMNYTSGSTQWQPATPAFSCHNFTYNFSGTGYQQILLDAGFSVSNNLSLNGSNATTARLQLRSRKSGSPFTVTCNGTVTCTNTNFQDITAAGSASWNLSGSTGGSGDQGGNTGITFDSPITCYWKSGSSANMSAANWFSTSGGSTPVRAPIPQDTARFDANSVTAGSLTITNNLCGIGTLNFTGVTNSPTYNIGSTSPSYTGSIILAGIGAIAGSGTISLNGRGSSYTIDLGGKTAPAAISIGGYQATYTAASNISATTTISVGGSYYVDAGFTTTCVGFNANRGSATLTGSLVNTGAFAFGGTDAFTVTFGSGTYSSTTFANDPLASLTTGSGLFTCTGAVTLGNGGTFHLGSGGLTAPSLSISGSGIRDIDFGTGTLTLNGTGTVFSSATGTNMTFTANTSTIIVSDTSATPKTFSGNTRTYNNLTISGDNVTTSGSFFLNGNLALNNAGRANGTLITAGTTITCADLIANGFAANLVTLQSTSAGSAATINSSGPVDLDYISVKDSTAAGNTPFYAGTHSTNVSGNTNWTFTARPTGNSYSFLMFF